MLTVLFTFSALVFVYTIAEFLRGARWIDRVALAALVVLGISTQPGLPEHYAAVTNSLSSGSPGMMMGNTDRAAAAAMITKRLRYGDLLVLSFTTLDTDITSVDVFGRVFVLGR